MTTLKREDMHTAAANLARSDKGRNALQHLDAWLSEGGCSLDCENQKAVIALLCGAWGSWAGTAREAIAEALEEAGMPCR